MERVLDVKELRTYFRTEKGVARAVDGVSFSIDRGATYALVGESGCGKSVTALSIIRLVRDSGYIAGGEVLLGGTNLLGLGEREMRAVRGRRISMVFQEPMTSLNPVFTVGRQITEVLELHRGLGRKEARAAAIEMLRAVKLPRPEALINEYPHRLSGGMRQRVMIAMALSLRPDLLIADEPTTALDVTIQDEILKLMAELKKSMGTAVLFITHNLALVYNYADTVGVMYAGKIVETAPARALFRNPLHPYTIQLMRSIPGASKKGAFLETIPGTVPPATAYPEGCRFSGRCPREMEGCSRIEPALIERATGHLAACHLHDRAFMNSPLSRPVARGTERPPSLSVPHRDRKTLLEVRGLRTYFPVKKGLLKRVAGYVKAVDGVDLTIKKGSTLALVGESGCGKTTAGKTILRLVEPTKGSIIFDGRDITGLGEREMKPYRSRMQIIFQDPYSSLDPRMTIRDLIEEGIISLKPDLTRGERLVRMEDVLERVGLSPEVLDRYPHEFSGGQRQRIGIARALAVDPEFIVCDEATSALDVSVQAQILNLLKSIQRDLGIALLFITHDLGIVEYMADEVAVMYGGRIVEYGPGEKVLSNPENDYTRRLLAAVPKIEAAL